MSVNRSDGMTSTAGQEKPKAGFLSALRAAALIALLVGAGGSVGMMLHAGQRKHSPRLLLALFAIWVLSPFVALVFANIASKGWSVITRATLYGVMLVLTLGSIGVNIRCIKKIYACIQGSLDKFIGSLLIEISYMFVVALSRTKGHCSETEF